MVHLSTEAPHASLIVLSCGTQVKAVCSSGGHFMKLVGGGFEYQGGETRLIAIPNFCRFAELSEALERIAGNAAANSSTSSEQVSILGPTNKFATHDQNSAVPTQPKRLQ